MLIIVVITCPRTYISKRTTEGFAWPLQSGPRNGVCSSHVVLCWLAPRMHHLTAMCWLALRMHHLTAMCWLAPRMHHLTAMCWLAPRMHHLTVMVYCVDWHRECTIWPSWCTVLTGTENAPSDRHVVLCWLALRMHHLTVMGYCVDWWNAPSDRHVVLCWLVKCTMNWNRFQR